MSENASPPVAATAARTTNLIIAVLAFAGIAVSVMASLVIPILGELPTLLHTSETNASWVVTSTLLAAAVATPVMGRLGDMHGKRRMILISLVLLVAGSLVSGLTSALVPMLIGRTLQGIGSGLIPLAISLLRDTVPRERLGSAVALISSSLGIGGALGLPAAAVVAQHLGWHELFYGAAILGALCFVLILFFVPESATRAEGRFDFVGAVGVAAGLLCLLVPLSEGGSWGWGNGKTLGLFAASLVVLLAWGWYELRVGEPLVDLRTSARRQVLFTNLTAVAIGFAMYGTSLLLPQLLQLPKATGYGLGQSMVAAGMCMAPGGFVMMLVSPYGAKLSRARGPKISLIVGAVIVGLGYLALLGLTHSVWEIIVGSCVVTAGIGFAYAAMPALIMSAVPVTETAAANALNSLMRSIGVSIASAAIAVVLAHSSKPFYGTELPTMSGFRGGFLIALAGCVAAVLVALFIPGIRKPADVVRERVAAESAEQSLA
jgi:MFS family permease